MSTPLTPSYQEKHLGQLVGKKVKRLVVLDSAGESHFDEGCYGLEFTDGTVAWIMCDPEGNGPGHLDIEPGANETTP